MKELRAPILMPNELEQFFDDQKVKDENGIVRLARGHDGNCVFLKWGRCSIYERRPLECQLYPWLINYEDGVLSLRIDPRCSDYQSAVPQQPPAYLYSLAKEFLERFQEAQD